MAIQVRWARVWAVSRASLAALKCPIHRTILRLMAWYPTRYPQLALCAGRASCEQERPQATCTTNTSRPMEINCRYPTHLPLTMRTAHAIRLRLIALCKVPLGDQICDDLHDARHLNLFRSTRQAASLATGILGTLPLRCGVLPGRRSHDVHMTRDVRLGIVRCRHIMTWGWAVGGEFSMLATQLGEKAGNDTHY